MRKGGKGFNADVAKTVWSHGTPVTLWHLVCLESDGVGTNKPKRKHVGACELKYGHLMQKIVTNRYLQ